MITAENVEKMLYKYQYWIKSIDPERDYLELPVNTRKWSNLINVLVDKNTRRNKKTKTITFSIITMEQLLKYLNKDKNNKYGSTKYNRAEED
jgi:hypothetical protein